MGIEVAALVLELATKCGVVDLVLSMTPKMPIMAMAKSSVRVFFIYLYILSDAFDTLDLVFVYEG